MASRQKLKTMSGSQRLVYSLAWIVIAAYIAYILFFFLFGILIALRENKDAFTNDLIDKKLFSFPNNPNPGNFVEAFDELRTVGGDTFWTITWNSFWRTTVSSLFSVGSSVMVCYILVFYRSRFTKFLYAMGIVVAILPIYGSAGASYKLFKDLGLINNPIILITSITLYGGSFFYMYALFKSMSWQYAEAAFIDGAGHFQVFRRIMLPMALPSISGLFVMSFISGWNDYESTLLYMNKYPNLSYAVYAYEEIIDYGGGNIPAYFAGVLISLVPILVLYVIFQNTIMEKVHLGGLKG